MRVRKGLAALTIAMVALGTAACGQQDGCYEDGQRVMCPGQGYDDDDDREYDDDEGWGEDDD